MRKLTTNAYLLVLSAGLTGLTPSAANAFSLDLFDSVDSDDEIAEYFNRNPTGNTITYPGQIVSINQNISRFGYDYKFNQTESDSGLTDVIGGARHIKVDATSGSDQVLWEVNDSNNTMKLTTGTNTDPLATIVWNGSSTINFNNLLADANLGLDLESGGDNAIGIKVQSADVASEFKLVISDGINTSSLSKSISSGAQDVYFDYESYTTSGVNINSVQYIALNISSTEDLDLELDFIQTAQIPFEFSPSLGILVVLGYGGIQLIRNQHKKSNLL